jgi:proteasome lid subunit RPN8/RPN11
MKISEALLNEVVAHALDDPRNEVCGFVAAADGTAVRVLPATNIHASPMKFEIEPKELRTLYEACEELGGIGAIYHSHVRSPPYPSQTDVNFAKGWPGVEWIIVGLSADSEPETRSYLIEGPDIREVPLVVQ